MKKALKSLLWGDKPPPPPPSEPLPPPAPAAQTQYFFIKTHAQAMPPSKLAIENLADVITSAAPVTKVPEPQHHHEKVVLPDIKGPDTPAPATWQERLEQRQRARPRKSSILGLTHEELKEQHNPDPLRIARRTPSPALDGRPLGSARSPNRSPVPRPLPNPKPHLALHLAGLLAEQKRQSPQRGGYFSPSSSPAPTETPDLILATQVPRRPLPEPVSTARRRLAALQPQSARDKPPAPPEKKHDQFVRTTHSQADMRGHAAEPHSHHRHTMPGKLRAAEDAVAEPEVATPVRHTQLRAMGVLDDAAPAEARNGRMYYPSPLISGGRRRSISPPSSPQRRVEAEQPPVDDVRRQLFLRYVATGAGARIELPVRSGAEPLEAPDSAAMYCECGEEVPQAEEAVRLLRTAERRVQTAVQEGASHRRKCEAARRTDGAARLRGECLKQRAARHQRDQVRQQLIATEVRTRAARRLLQARQEQACRREAEELYRRDAARRVSESRVVDAQRRAAARQRRWERSEQRSQNALHRRYKQAQRWYNQERWPDVWPRVQRALAEAYTLRLSEEVVHRRDAERRIRSERFPAERPEQTQRRVQREHEAVRLIPLVQQRRVALDWRISLAQRARLHTEAHLQEVARIKAERDKQQKNTSPMPSARPLRPTVMRPQMGRRRQNC